MKDFDTVEYRAARTLGEAEHWFKQHKEAAARQEFTEGVKERVKAIVNRVVFKEGRL